MLILKVSNSFVERGTLLTNLTIYLSLKVLFVHGILILNPGQKIELIIGTMACVDFTVRTIEISYYVLKTHYSAIIVRKLKRIGFILQLFLQHRDFN